LKNKNKKLSEYKIGSFEIFVKDPIPENVNINAVFEEVESLLPEHFLNLIDVVYIGNFPFFEERNINSMYLDGALYVSSEQDDNDDMKDDIVHEIAHALEEKYNDFLYDDEKIKNEYFGKLKKLRNYLSFENYDLRGINFFNVKYNQQFDEFLLNEVGYDRLSGFAEGLFLAPYSITSLREYFARAFEEFFLGDRLYLKSICPYSYKKLLFLYSNLERLEYER
jgi:hypothetical protein